jgi:hypothetical protein
MDTPELGALITQPGQEDVKEGTSAVGPSIPAEADPANPLVTIEMTPEQCKEWIGRIQKSDERIKKEAESWKILMNAYTPVVRAQGVPEDVSANSHFRNVHTKLGQMFVRTPQVTLEPAPNSPADNQKPGPPGPDGIPQMLSMADIISVKQEYLNKRLGRDGIKVNRLFDELNIDWMAWSGLGCSKLGYKAVTKVVQQPVMGPDPNFVPPPQPPGTVMGLRPDVQTPQVPQMGPDGQPITKPVPVTVYEEIYWRRFSPMKLVTDVMTYSTRHDEDATFLGMHFSMYPAQAAAAFQIPIGDLRGGEDELRYKHKNDQESGPNVVTGVELFYKAAYYLPGEVHPWKLVQLVFLDHIQDKPAVHRLYQDQDFTPEGELSETSIDRFPIRVLTARDFPDSQFPPSDSAFTQNLSKQLNTNRQQGVALRDSAIGKVLFDGGKLEDGDVMKVRNAKPGDWIEVADGALDKGKDSVATTISQPTRTQDDYRLDTMLQHNMDETLGISANAAGGSEDTVRSATEIQTIQKAVQGRNEKEQSRIIDHFLDGVRLIDILIMRYTTQQQWVKITGNDGMARMQAWNGEMVSGRWLYDIAIDSQLTVDTAQDRQQNLNLYNLTKGDPLVNRVPVLQRMFRSFGYDPSKCVMNPQQAISQAQPQHADAVNAHEMGKSGGREGQPGSPNHRDTQP